MLVNIQLISSLFKCNTKYILVFQCSRYIIRIDLDHIVIAVLFLFQNLKCLRLISRCDHTVRNLSLDQSGCIYIADI